MYGGLGMGGGGAAGSVDNGDGTFTFTFADGRPELTAAGPIAKQKHDQLEQQMAMQPDPSIAEAGKPGEDMRTAQSFPGMGGAGGVGKPPSSLDDAAQQGQSGNVQVSDVGGAPVRQGESVPTEQGLAAAKLPGAVSGGAQENMAGANPQQVDPSKLSFGNGGGSGGFGLPPTKTYVAPRDAAWIPARKTEQPGFQASESLQTSRQAAEGLQGQAVEDAHGAQQQKTALETTLAANRAESVGLELANDQARMTRQQNQVNARMTELDKLGDDISKEKIDPNQLFHEAGAIGNIAMTIAAAAGSFAQGLTGAPNTAMDNINKKVERNIAGQQANLAHKKEMYGAKRQQLGILQQSFANENEQDAAHRVLTWKAVDAQLDAQKAKLGGAFDDAAYTQMKAGVQQKIADARGGYEKEAWNQTAIVSGYQPAQKGGYVTNSPKASPFQHNLFVPQFGGNASTEKEAIDARDAGKTLQGIDSLVQQNLALRNDPKAFVKGTDSYAKLQSNQAQLSLQLKNSEKLGVLAGPDMGLITGAIGDGTSIMPGQSAALSNYLGNAKQRNDFARQNLGIIPVQVGPYMDPKTGEMRMGQVITGNVAGPVNAPQGAPRSQDGAMPAPTAQPQSFQYRGQLQAPGSAGGGRAGNGPKIKRHH